jgi:hypothetical protein
MVLECSRPTDALSFVPLITPREIAVSPNLLNLLSFHLCTLLFLGEVISDPRCAFLEPLARKVSLLFILVIL